MLTTIHRTLFILALLLPTISVADYNGRKLAVALGQYISIVANMEYLKSSKCGYLINTSYSVDQSLRDGLLHFRIEDRDEIKSYFKDNNILKLAENDMEGFLDASTQDGLDIKSACGMLLGTLSGNFTTIRADYEKAISMYSK
jgi:hypothetical protein